MKTNEAGQLLVDVMDFPPSTRPCPATQQNSKITSDCKSSPVTAPSRKTKITLKNKECRCLLAQWKHTDMQKQSSICVAELFSPPRFTSEAVKHGLQGRAYDIKQGWNLDDAKTQQIVDRELDTLKPELLVACPPRTNRGGWDKLNRRFRSPIENAITETAIPTSGQVLHTTDSKTDQTWRCILV